MHQTLQNTEIEKVETSNRYGTDILKVWNSMDEIESLIVGWILENPVGT
jgi:hypothetical protein